ncbi:MAG: hypothetical protein HKL82_01090 [Acidimicrobiaceae bacterium]|nr:hypothetical protein [Acidimicrobiaceae bacterium]
MKYVKAFFMFWFDFLIGDTPEIFVGALIVLGVAAVAAKSSISTELLPALVIVTLVLSVGWAVTRSVLKTKR